MGDGVETTLTLWRNGFYDCKLIYTNWVGTGGHVRPARTSGVGSWSRMGKRGLSRRAWGDRFTRVVLNRTVLILPRPPWNCDWSAYPNGIQLSQVSPSS